MPRRLDHHRVGGLDLGRHLRETEQDRLVLRDRLAERLALLGVGDAELEGPVGDAARPRRDVDAAHLDAVHHLVEALARLAAEDLLGTDPVALEDGLGRVDALVAHLVDLARDGQAGSGLAEAGLLLHQEGRHVLVDAVGALVGLDQRRDQRRGPAVGQPHLLAGDRVAAVVALRRLGRDRRRRPSPDQAPTSRTLRGPRRSPSAAGTSASAPRCRAASACRPR